MEANSPRAIQEAIAEARKNGLRAPTKADEKPMGEVAKPAQEPPPDLKAAEENTPASTETPAETTEETPTETPEAPAETPEEEEEQIEEGQPTPIKAKRPRVQLPDNDEVGRLALAFQKRNRDWSLSQAIAAAQKQLGVTPEGAKVEATPDKPKSDLPESVQGVDTALETAESEREKAFTELRFEDVAKIDRKIRQLDRHRTVLEREGERQQSQAVQAYHAKFAQSDAKATELYEAAGKADSPFGKRMAEIDADLEANGDPLYHSPDKPLRIAQMVATEMNIAPRKKGAPVVTPAKAAAPAPVVPAGKKGVVPSGASRTTPPAVNQKPAIQVEVENVKSIRDLREIRKKLGLGY